MAMTEARNLSERDIFRRERAIKTRTLTSQVELLDVHGVLPQLLGRDEQRLHAPAQRLHPVVGRLDPVARVGQLRVDRVEVSRR